MIIELKEDKITDIAITQVSAWREAFKGILSEKLLSNLLVEDFAENWKRILTQAERSNYIWVNEYEKGVGFISFGKPKDKNEIADFEIYGIYVHPSYWGKSIGYELMKFAMNSITTLNPSAKIILWTMRENKLSQQFYTRFGYIANGKSRIAGRHDESFEEIQFEIRINH